MFFTFSMYSYPVSPLPASLLSPLLVEINSEPERFKHRNLRAAAALALSKFMLVSSVVCEEHLQVGRNGTTANAPVMGFFCCVFIVQSEQGDTV